MFKYSLTSLFFATKVALISEVRPNLRAVQVASNEGEQTARIWLYFDGEITEEEMDVESTVSCEVSTLIDQELISSELVRLDFPEPFPENGYFAFLRDESQMLAKKAESQLANLIPTFQIKKQCLYNEPKNINYLELCLQDALLGKIRPNLRAVKADMDESKKVLYFWFYFHENISEEELFNNQYAYEEHIERLDYPAKIPHIGMTFYKRYEKLVDVVNVQNSWTYPEENIAFFLSRMQTQLLGNVRPNLRAVKLDVNEHERKLYTWFFFDGNISSDDSAMAEEITRRLLPGGSLFVPVIAKEQLNFPQIIPHIGTYAYLRDESIQKLPTSQI